MANLIFSFVCLCSHIHYFTYTTKYTFAHTAAAFGWILDTGNNDKIGLYRIIWERFGSHVYRTPNLYSRNVNRTQRTLNSYSKHKILGPELSTHTCDTLAMDTILKVTTEMSMMLPKLCGEYPFEHWFFPNMKIVKNFFDFSILHEIELDFFFCS